MTTRHRQQCTNSGRRGRAGPDVLSHGRRARPAARLAVRPQGVRPAKRGRLAGPTPIATLCVRLIASARNRMLNRAADPRSIALSITRQRATVCGDELATVPSQNLSRSLRRVLAAARSPLSTRALASATAALALERSRISGGEPRGPRSRRRHRLRRRAPPTRSGEA
jgi:hypothetical protein